MKHLPSFGTLFASSSSHLHVWDNTPLVVTSHCSDIYTNLAVEELLLAAFDKCVQLSSPDRFKRPRTADCPPLAHPPSTIVYSYINSKAVVMGRNQDPWIETNIGKFSDPSNGVLFRRRSGGGTVVHDEGNLCLSFMTPRTEYSPKKNIELLKRFLSDYLRLPPSDDSRFISSERHDLFLDGYKITGSAMRLLNGAAYHHCTLLVSSDTSTFSQWLTPDSSSVFSDANLFSSSGVPSVKASARSLGSLGLLRKDETTSDSKSKVRATEELREELLNQLASSTSVSFSAEDVLSWKETSPEIAAFVGLEKQKMKAAKWLLGETPRIRTVLPLQLDLFISQLTRERHPATPLNSSSAHTTIMVKSEIHGGCVQNVSVVEIQKGEDCGHDELISFFVHIVNVLGVVMQDMFVYNDGVLDLLKTDMDEEKKVISQCLSALEIDMPSQSLAVEAMLEDREDCTLQWFMGSFCYFFLSQWKGKHQFTLRLA